MDLIQNKQGGFNSTPPPPPLGNLTRLIGIIGQKDTLGWVKVI